MQKIALTHIVSILIVIVTIFSIAPYSTLPLSNYFLSITLYYSCIFLFISLIKKHYERLNNKYLIFVSLYLCWVLISITRGFFVADTYWDWKNLSSGSAYLLIATSAYIFTNTAMVQKILSYWFKHAIPLFILISFFTFLGGFGFYLAPLTLLILFFPVLNQKWKGIFIFFLFFIFLGYTNRSSVIKYSLPLLISFLYYFRQFFFFNSLLKTIRIGFLVAPFVFLTLGVSGEFNIFEMEEYFGEQKTTRVVNGEIREESLTADTRTSLYEEVINSAINNNYVVQGRSLARGNDSESFGALVLEVVGEDAKAERYSNETGILNLFTWTGAIGVLLYFLVFVRASYLAIYKSKNVFIKLVGVFVSFRWFYFWIEDVTRFDITNIIIWMMIGMCCSIEFRSMSNKEFKIWVQGIFKFKYRTLLKNAKNSRINNRFQS